MSMKFTDWVLDEQENREDSFLDNCYERAFVIYSYDKNLHLAHLQNSNMPLKDFLKSYKVKMRELDVDEVIYHIWTNPWSLLRGSMPKMDKPVGILSKTYKKND